MQIVKKSSNPIQDLGYLEMEVNNNSLLKGLDEVAQGIMQIVNGHGYGNVEVTIQDKKVKIVKVTQNIQIKDE